VSIQVWHSEGYAYIKNTLSELVNVELIDMTGRSLLKTTETTSEHETLKIKLPPLRAGIYLIKVSNGANYISVKFNHN
jgi:ABC-type arginine transport system permease subunit